MNEQSLETTAKYLVSSGRGILAADESTTSANKRFAAVGVAETEENRRIYRQLLMTTPAAKEALSGVIFYDETFWQNIDLPAGAPAQAGGVKSFHDYCTENGIMPGIKLDEGLVDLPGFPGEKISKGLDTLPERIVKYRDAGAKFAKWRSVIAIGHVANATGEAFSIPTEECINANAFVLARYARICQDAGIVPIVEPEVLFDGKHTGEECEQTLARVLSALFVAMRAYRVYLPGAILKTSMVLPGKESGIAIEAADVADRTVRVLREYVPGELGGVVFLSGGQSAADGLKNLNAIVRGGQESGVSWGLTFSYSRALQDPVLKHWASHQDDITGAQTIFARQLAMAVAAREGKLVEGAETESFVSAGQDL